MATFLLSSAKSAALGLVLCSFLAALGASHAFYVLPSLTPSSRMVRNHVGFPQPRARVASRKSWPQMQQSILDDFDDDQQYSMDSLSFSENNDPAPMEYAIPAPQVSNTDKSRSTQLKLNVLMACTGLDRGSAADSEQRAEVENAVKALEAQSSSGSTDFPEGFNGRWRLVYTSALSPGSESGGGAGANSLPFFQTPAPAARLSFGGRGQIGQVFQNVDVRKGQLDNVVEVNTPGPLPLGKTTLTLEHKLEFTPGSPKRCKITLVNVAVDGPLKQLGLQPLKLPVLEAISSQGAGVFDTTYCDQDMRIARGDRGELRVFIKR
mmetsp:Transcript_25737/g.61065  ORF Transcript_25737/g.61065 Transcript_25737/m.61065 type:complete len:322 (-) Transcript_25737:207-1172(-)